MKIKSLAKNVTEVEMNNGDMILVSYSTPVAAHISGRGFVKSSAFHSTTTSRHVNKWIGVDSVAEEPQEFFDALYGEI